MIKEANQYFSPEVIEYIKKSILENDGQEITFAGNVDRNGVVFEVEVLAYGNEDSSIVPDYETLKADVLIHNHPFDELEDLNVKEILRASQNDISVASTLANLKIGFYIIDNNCEFVNIIYQPQKRYYLDEDEIKKVFENNGILSKILSYYEERYEQIKLVETIVHTINDSGLLIAEAGTGTGKSIAYLIPVALWAIHNKKRVLISTYTINLQQQILQKDMIIVSQVVKILTGKNIEYSILIGKNNYLCKKRLNDIYKDVEKQNLLFSDNVEIDILREILEWSEVDEEGDLNKFNYNIPQELWDEICCPTIGCSKKKCDYYSNCFYTKARLTAEKSNIIIVNHSLVFSTIDEQSLKSSLPFFAGIIFDEGHHIEDTALKALAKTFSIQEMIYVLKKIYLNKNFKESGLLVLLSKKCNLSSMRNEINKKIEDLKQIVENLLKKCYEFLDTFLPLLEQFNEESQYISIDSDFKKTSLYNIIKTSLEKIFIDVCQIISYYNDLSMEVKNFATNKEILDILNMIKQRVENLNEMNSIYNLIFYSDENIVEVRWIEKTKNNIKFSNNPLEVNDFVSNSIYNKKDFILILSATLMINKSYDFFKYSTGVNFVQTKQIYEISLDSPFDYKNQVELYILNEDINHSEISSQKINLIKSLCLISNGGVLVLFTSYQRLKEVYEKLKNKLEANGLIVFRQGMNTRDYLLNEMKNKYNVVLFATASFWEGIDIQGDNLRCVIIEKLPFDSPSDPIYKAKERLLESKSINAFVHYSIPRAILRFKQGFGRLIRSKQDKGIVALLDNRIKTKNYGIKFLSSIPECKMFYTHAGEIIIEASKFFSSKFNLNNS